jgi:hypothetical protein
LLLCALIATKVVHAVWNHERCARSITRWASAEMSGHGPTGEGFVFHDVAWPWLPAVRSCFGGAPVPFVVHDVTIYAPGGDEILRAQHVQGRIHLGHLVWTLVAAKLAGHSAVELLFDDTIVDEVRCRITGRADGDVDLVAAFRAPPGHGKSSPSSSPRDGFVVSVVGTRVLGGSYAMRFPKWHAVAEQLRGDIAMLRYSSYANEQAPDRPAFTYRARRIESPRGEVVIEHRSIPLTDLVATRFEAVDPDPQDLAMKGTVHSLGSTLSFDGGLVDTYARTTHGIDLSFEARHTRGLKERFLPTNALSGDPTVRMRIHGRFSDVTLSGSVQHLEATAEGITASEVASSYRFHALTLALRDIDSIVAGGHVRGTARVDIAAQTFAADLTQTGIKPAQLARKNLPIEVLAYLDGLASRVLHERATTDVVEHVSMHGVTVQLHRHPHETFPYRIEVSGRARKL